MPEMLSLFSAYGIISFAVLWSFSRAMQYWSFKAQLDKIPTIGYSGVFTSYISAFRVLTNARDMIQEGYDKFYGGVFKIPMLDHWLVVVSGPKMIDEIRRASDDQISSGEALREFFQTDHTLGKHIHFDPYHILIIRSALTRNIEALFSDVRDETLAAFASEIPLTEDWVKVPVLNTTMNIVSRTSNRIFVGLPVCRNPDFMDLNIKFTIDVILVAKFINLWPNFMKPVVGRIMSPVTGSIKRPIIEERLAKADEYGPDWPGKPNDMLSWLIDGATTSERRTVRDLTIRILTVNFAAIHTTSLTFTKVLYQLAGHPEYVQELREEVESVIEKYGWTKAAMGHLRKLDSFVKETERFVGHSAVTLRRKALQDFTLSNGTTIPAGAFIGVASRAMHRDEDLYPGAHEFKGFRFAELREGEGESDKHQMVTPNLSYIVFGNGSHACPGRFFAVNEIKIFIAHVLLTYDVKFENEGSIPELQWFGIMSSPNRTAEVMFRKRRA